MSSTVLKGFQNSYKTFCENFEGLKNIYVLNRIPTKTDIYKNRSMRAEKRCGKQSEARNVHIILSRVGLGT